MDTETPSARNKTVLITGSTQGLGRHVALDLAGKGATLLLHGRDRGRLDQVAAEVRATAPDVPVRTYLADLADLDQVLAMAARILDAESRLDILVNNVAIGFGTDRTRREVSHQGHELRFAVNYLAPCLLTRELLPLLTASSPARVVNVASIGQAPIDFDDVMLERGYGGVDAYCRSKLAMIMSTFDLAAELVDSRVTVNALHPAHLMDTPGVRESGLTPDVGIDEGVRPTVRLITDPALETVTGKYFEQFTESPAHEQAYDSTARTRLAALTRSLLA
ncbi:SDR family NAD(P)-dependent oxidoreductase [Streptomyces sp. NPDC051644]|uniref:SDR family NAD(P)-dependent oxidoreductase n=1 Tax=Streptomyces sp. NPDC051644 TaxID=3365666 RepID=UPI0037B99923